VRNRKLLVLCFSAWLYALPSAAQWICDTQNCNNPTLIYPTSTTAKVGVGTQAPNARFHSHQAANSNFELFDSSGGLGESGVMIDSVGDCCGGGILYPMYYNASRHVFLSGNVGIGSFNYGFVPLYALHLYRSDNGPKSLAVQSSNNGSNSYADGDYLADKVALSIRAYGSGFNTFARGSISLANMSEIWADQTVAESNGGLLIGTGVRSTAPLPPIIFATQNTERMRISGDGNVTIKTPTSGYALDVTGTVHATGAITSDAGINAAYQDVAEWVPAAEPLSAGTVVVLNAANGNEVMPSASPYDTTVAGVVSEHPGIILGKGGPDKAQIATTGRVKVKVDARNNPICVGDLLVTSDLSGTAMRSVPVAVSGISMHRPGTIIGKALEPLQAGTGEILVLLSLQ
jgi:hypothetical protein